MSATNFTTSLQHFENDVYGLHLPVPEDVAKKFVHGEDRRVICVLNAKHKMHSGLMAAKPYWYILINKQVAKSLQLNIGDTVNVSIQKDESKYGMEMPAELEEAMAQDDVGNNYFHALTPGKQRNLIYIVSKVKNSQSRINKSLAIMHHLVEMEGKLDFKKLNQTIKEYNQLK